jgi:hypothetical protein
MSFEAVLASLTNFNLQWGDIIHSKSQLDITLLHLRVISINHFALL